MDEFNEFNENIFSKTCIILVLLNLKYVKFNEINENKFQNLILKNLIFKICIVLL